MEIEEAIKIIINEAEENINKSEEKSIGKQQALALVKSMVQFFELQSSPDSPMPDYIPEERKEVDEPTQQNES